MTLTAYLSLLFLGSSIELRSESDDDEHEEQVDRLHRLDNAINEAQINVIRTVSRHGAPMELRASRESIASGVLTVGTVVANYTLCFPIVVARHRLQAFPVSRAWDRDTPLYFIRRFWSDYQRRGLRSMYPGFGLGLLGQILSTAYESVLGSIISSFLPKNASLWRHIVLKLTNACLGWGIHIFLYPFNRNALILRVQAAGTHQPIQSARDFGASYKRDLLRFLSPTSGSLPLLSVVIPSCLLHAVTEKIMVFVYNSAYHLVTAPSRKHHRRWERKSRRQHHNDEPLSQQRQDNNNTNTTSAAEIPEFPAVTDYFATAPKAGTTERNEDRVSLHTYYPEVVCGVMTSLITRIISYPFDTVLFKLILQDSGIQPYQTSYTGFFDCIARTWRYEGGWKAFFPGWGGCVLEIAISYLVLEGSWMIYRVIDRKIQAYPEHEPRIVRKARYIRGRMGLST